MVRSLKHPFVGLSCWLGCAVALSAQNLERNSTVEVDPSGSVEIQRVQVDPSESAPVLDKQDAGTLERRVRANRSVESVVNLKVLEHPSPFQKVAYGRVSDADPVPAESVKRDLEQVSAVYREQGRRESDCNQVRLSVEGNLKLDPTRMLEIVEAEVSANASCSCEIVKSAITTMQSDVEEVLAIVQVAINAAPDQMRIISQCAIAASPESLTEVQSLLARYDTNAGEEVIDAKSSKSAKDAKASIVVTPNDVAAVPNPLDFPGIGPVGPAPGGPGGTPLFPPDIPVIVTPPSVTIVDP